MKSGIIFTGTGPILILTTYGSLTHPGLAEKMAAKGIQKYVACELEVDRVREKYGAHFTAIINDVKQENDLRVLDYNGHNVFYNFAFREMGEPVFHEAEEFAETSYA